MWNGTRRGNLGKGLYGSDTARIHQNLGLHMLPIRSRAYLNKSINLIRRSGAAGNVNPPVPVHGSNRSYFAAIVVGDLRLEIDD